MRLIVPGIHHWTKITEAPEKGVPRPYNGQAKNSGARASWIRFHWVHCAYTDSVSSPKTDALKRKTPRNISDDRRPS